MKLGVICDGMAEASALKSLVTQVDNDGVQVLRPIYAPMQPSAPAGAIAKAAQDRLNFLRSRKVEKVVVIIDREDNYKCAPLLSNEIFAALKNKNPELELAVVVKNRTFENWLIADPEGVSKSAKCFEVSQANRRRVSNGNADNVDDAAAWLNAAKHGSSYHKASDPVKIIEAMDPYIAAKNSRSLRKFFREIGCKIYEDQSRSPRVK